MLLVTGAHTGPVSPLRRSAVLAVGVVVAVLLPACAASAAPYDTAWTRPGPGAHRSSPTQGTLSVGEVVLAADMGGWVRAIRPDGSLAWRAPVDPVPGQRTAVESSPAVGELTPDPGNEVVVGAGSIHPPFLRQWGGVVAFRGDGTTAWRWLAPDRFGPQGRPDGAGDGIFSSPAIGDVDGDGRNDVVFGGWDHNVWALRGSDGTVIPGFPFENTDTVWSSPALHDVDGDGAAEIFIGGDQTRSVDPASYDGGVLRSLSVKGGRVVQNWRVNVPDIVASSPAVGDINADGRLEAVFASGEYWKPEAGKRVWAVHLTDGSTVPGWPVRTEGLLFGSPALGDVVPGDGGRPEVVLGDVSGFVYAWRGDGSLAWRTNPGPGDDTFYSGPSLADLDGDGDADVAIGYGFGGALLLRGHDGSLLRRVGGSPFASMSTPLVADFGASVGRRLVLTTFSPHARDFSAGEVQAFVLPQTSAPAPWPMFRKDARHLGGGKPPATAQPWVRGAIAQRYVALGGPDGFLGAPVTPERPTPRKPGAYNHFQGGSIYWSPGTGAWEVHGAIRDRWAALGWENGFLGFPLTNENRLRGGAFSRFQGGHVYWSPATGAAEVHGEIFRAWAATGHENGRLGYPTTDERRTPNRRGAYNHFQRGSVYWSPGTGAHVVEGAIREVWARAGWEQSCLGFPTSGERDTVVGGVRGRVSEFEGGSVTWTPAGGAVVRCR